MMRIAVAGLVHETNTFAPSPTTYADFDMHGSSPPILRGEAILAEFGHGHGGGSIGGLVRALQAADVEIVPLLWCAAQPGGTVTAEAFERLSGEILSGLEGAGPLDAVVLDLHGAMVADGIEDAEGVLLERIRRTLGHGPFVSAVLDFHGNVSADMVRHSDLLLAYRTYPHVDMEEAGARLVRETLSCLSRGARPEKAFFQLPYLVPIHAQCTLIQPMADLLEIQQQADARHGAVTSLLAGFPPADIHDCGPSILAYAPDRESADSALDHVRSAALAAEPAFAAIGLRTGPEAVSHALDRSAATGRPVIIVDTQDNPGAGATSDTMGLVEELLAQHARDAVMAVVHDPDAAGQAHAAGVGAAFSTALGGKGEKPFSGTFHVEALAEGRFSGTGAYYNGAELNFGPMALLRIGDSGVRVIVGSRRAQAGTQAIFRHLGLDPAAAGILGLKSSVHFLADFAALTPEIVYAAFPGLNTADPESFAYRHIRPSLRRRPSDRPLPAT